MDAAVAGPPRAIDLGAERPFRVGGASIDPASRDATFNGTVERLQPQNLKVLIALARQTGKVVTRDDLVDLCWDGRFVGDDVINRAISTLRQFAERAGGFSIETVPRAGYRLVETSPSRRPRLWRWTGAAAAAALVAGVTAYALIDRLDHPGTPPTTPTVAVLPFSVDSPDPDTRELALAARDSVAHMLSKTQFPVRLVSSATDGDRPAADFLISADVSSDPGKVMATVRMEDTAHHAIVYSHRFEASRDKARLLPDQVGAQVAGPLGWTASLLMLDRSHPSDPGILKQLFQDSDVADLSALQNYENARRVAKKAPNSAVAEIDLAFTAAFALNDLPRDQRAEAVALGRHAMDRALMLAPEFGEPYSTWCLLHSSARRIECEDQLRVGMRVNPDAPFVALFLADRLKDAGRMGEALELAKQSLARDQYVPAKIALTLRMLEATGQQEEAEKLFRQAQRWWPYDSDIFWRRASGIIDRGDFDALVRFEDEVGSANFPTGYVPLGALAAAVKAGDVAAAKKTCPQAQLLSFRSDLCMLALARLGDNDDAFGLAEPLFADRVGRTRGEEERIWLDNPWVPDTDVITGSAAAPMRRDPRYLKLAERLGLLAYWRSGRLPDFCTVGHEPVCSRIVRAS